LPPKLQVAKIKWLGRKNTVPVLQERFLANLNGYILQAIARSNLVNVRKFTRSIVERCDLDPSKFKDDQGNNLLHLAVMYHDSEVDPEWKILKELIACNPDSSAVTLQDENAEGKTPLELLLGKDNQAFEDVFQKFCEILAYSDDVGMGAAVAAPATVLTNEDFAQWLYKDACQESLEGFAHSGAEMGAAVAVPEIGLADEGLADWLGIDAGAVAQYLGRQAAEEGASAQAAQEAYAGAQGPSVAQASGPAAKGARKRSAQEPEGQESALKRARSEQGQEGVESVAQEEGTFTFGDFGDIDNFLIASGASEIAALGIDEQELHEQQQLLDMFQQQQATQQTAAAQQQRPDSPIKGPEGKQEDR